MHFMLKYTKHNIYFLFFYVFRMVPKVKITPIDTNQPEVEQNGPYDRSYLREEDTRSFFIL